MKIINSFSKKFNSFFNNLIGNYLYAIVNAKSSLILRSKQHNKNTKLIRPPLALYVCQPCQTNLARRCRKTRGNIKRWRTRLSSAFTLQTPLGWRKAKSGDKKFTITCCARVRVGVEAVRVLSRERRRLVLGGVERVGSSCRRRGEMRDLVLLQRHHSRGGRQVGVGVHVSRGNPATINQQQLAWWRAIGAAKSPRRQHNK